MLNIKPIKFILLFLIFFIVLTERVTIVNLCAGLLLSGAVYFLNREVLPEFNIFSWRTLPYWLLFIVYLLRDVVTSNLQVARVVLSREMQIAPKLVYFKSQLAHGLLLTIHANAITLTPGTMTVDIKDNLMQIHCLSQDYVEGLKDSDIEKTLMKIEALTRLDNKGGLQS